MKRKRLPIGKYLDPSYKYSDALASRQPGYLAAKFAKMIEEQAELAKRTETVVKPIKKVVR